MLVCFSQNYVKLQETSTNSEIIKNSEDGFIFSSSFEGFHISEVNIKDRSYVRIIIPEYYPDNNTGFPELPVMTKLVEIPEGAEIEVNIIRSDKQIINIPDYAMDYPVYPNQESVRKDIDPLGVKFHENKKVYQDKEFYSTELVKIQILGKMREVQIAQLIISPFSYDIESNTLHIDNNIEVEVKFKNADFVSTSRSKADKYSPVFESLYEKIWNYRPDQTKRALSQYPIKYVIVSDRMFEETLQPFIEWKTKKGFNVVTAYTDEIGTTFPDIKTYIKNLYDYGTPGDPAPTYLLLVGDIEQIPATTVGSHVTDLYYCEFDGGEDYVPEMYFGRFSATTTEQLKIQIDKTLMYEKYTFPDPSFLRNSLLVSGVDATYSQTHTNGQMNYAHNYYFNEAHGVDATMFLYPESQNKLSEILETLNSGTGYVNYSAHCDYTGWQKPYFNISQFSNLNNENEYFFSVGNCCLSNQFNKPECFGEALLRSGKKGAVAHLGGSDNTYWNEDYYWSVGLSGNFTANPTYEDTQPGVYDHLFHENGEAPYITAGQMNFIGNMSVFESTSDRKKYYFEIYHVMGDPSIMPYIGIPDQLTVNYDMVISVGIDFLRVNTEPGTYVAISVNSVLLDAVLADSEGVADLQFDVQPLGTVMDVVLTKQFKIPHIGQVEVIQNDNNNDVMMRKINSPVQKMHYSESTFSPNFEIINIGNSVLESAVLSYQIDDNEPVEKNWTGNLQTFETMTIDFPQITLPDGTYNFVAMASSPNNVDDENPDNNTITRTVIVYSGDVSIEEVVAPGFINCNTTTVIPEIIVKNNDDFTLTSLVCRYECGEFSDEITWTGTLNPDNSENIQFPPKNLSDGNYTITFYISSPNSGTNNSTIIEKSVDFEVNNNGYLIELDFKTDNYGHENSWELVDLSNGDILFSDGNFASNVVTHNIYEWCLEAGCYRYTVFDSYRDGMGGSAIWGRPPGAIKISNITDNEIILDIMGNVAGFNSSYSIGFCMDPDFVVCPEEVRAPLKDTIICFDQALPPGGNYSGTGVQNGCINPEEFGEGIHEITYSYVFPDGEKSCTFNLVVGLSSVDDWENDNNKINIYPNPTNGIIYVDTYLENNIDIEIFNIFGQSVLKNVDVKGNVELDLSDFPAGTYIFRICDGNNIFNKKFSLLK
jgi:hypothetical protein